MAVTPPEYRSNLRVALIGFGEAGQAFASGWLQANPGLDIRAYDIKTDSADKDISARKWADYEREAVTGCATVAEAVTGATAVFCLVTADQASAAASSAAAVALEGALFFDGNSCAPGTKRRSAQMVQEVGGRYVDCAIMAPVHPRRHQTPLLFAGGHAEHALALADALGMSANAVEGDVGAASAIKMTRSIMMKGLEALVLECVLAGRSAGVEDKVLASLEATYPGFDWTGRAAYMMERAMTHGIRRAAEMREVVVTIEELGLPADMARATVEWEQRVGELGLDSADYAPDYQARAGALLASLPVGNK